MDLERLCQAAAAACHGGFPVKRASTKKKAARSPKPRNVRGLPDERCARLALWTSLPTFTKREDAIGRLSILKFKPLKKREDKLATDTQL